MIKISLELRHGNKIFSTILLTIFWIGTSCGQQGQMPSTMYHEVSATCLSGKIKVNARTFFDSPDHHVFEIIGQTTGWIGIGFSVSGNMTGADILLGWIKNGNVTVTERKAIKNGFPPLKPKQLITILGGSESNGLTRLKFSVSSSRLGSLITFTPLLCAYGNDDPTGSDIGEGDYHGIYNRELTCFENEFLCQDRSQCIHFTTFCNERPDCEDGSDEYNYNIQNGGRECGGKDLVSSRKRCLLPERYVCDGNSNCANENDECMCDLSSVTGYLDKKCFRCLRNPSQLIPITKLCNGVFDCMDLTDECICEKYKRPAVCNAINIFVGSQVSQRFVCEVKNSSIHHELDIEKICDNVNNCETGIDEENCIKVQYQETVKLNKDVSIDNERRFKCLGEERYAIECDGIVECRYEAYDEECENSNKKCKNPPKICNIPYDEYERRFKCGDEYGGTNFIYGSNICNGIKDCSDGVDELDCRGRFYCLNDTTKNIPMEKKCDHLWDCDDGSDEFNCSFFCNDSGTTKVIDPNKVCDGTFDCKGGSDECLPKCITSAFSSVKSLIANRVFLSGIWILSLLAFVGNFSVAVFSIREFSRFKKGDNVVRKINKSLVFNLSLSDLLVGIYLISICIRNAMNEGEYCFIDRDWRSGITCSALGAVLLVGSEQSVFTMAIITGVRLYTVLRPMKKPNVRLIKLSVALSWIISVSLGTIPVIPPTQDYFVESIRYQNNQLFSTINHEDVEYYTKWLLLTNEYANESDHFGYVGSWSFLEHLIGKLHKNYTVHGKFGYYSKHGVCVAPLFPNPKRDTSWIYTFMIILINFLAFFFIFAGYVAIYCFAKKQKRRVQRKPDVNMQKKITRIIVTDFFCWMPICIMGMMQVSGISIPNDAYVFVGMILIPINSALNPFLYSDIPDYIWQKIEPLRAWTYRHCTTLKNRVINFCRKSNENQSEVQVETREMRVIEDVGNQRCNRNSR